MLLSFSWKEINETQTTNNNNNKKNTRTVRSLEVRNIIDLVRTQNFPKN